MAKLEIAQKAIRLMTVSWTAFYSKDYHSEEFDAVISLLTT